MQANTIWRRSPSVEGNPHKGISSPKQIRISEMSRASWFQYYAGFSSAFVVDMIEHLDLPISTTLLDPWLGSGTTSEIAAARGFRIKGFDLNPAMLIVARARTLPTYSTGQITSFKKAICLSYKRAIKINKKLDHKMNEPLEQWLQPASARYFRLLERTVVTAIPHEGVSIKGPMWMQAGQSSALLAFFYVGLFRTLRHFIVKFRSSNPTWIKTAKGKDRIYVSAQKLLTQLDKEIDDLLTVMHSESNIMPKTSENKCEISCASSTRLPLPHSSVDVIISSPPYCTRIDYVRATLPELAVIDYPNGSLIRHLRESMIGTPTIQETVINRDLSWGTTCSHFLSAVQRHQSRASSTYYLKYYLQYFAGMFASLCELDRVLKKSGRCVLVVQDSFYKEVRNDLPRMFIEMAEGLGWKLDQKLDYPVNNSFSQVNRKAQHYRKFLKAKESVLAFSK